ncbi:glutamate--cysteine ligase regulatory subunit-like [Mizuhopecten yessoensis]|uniref:glutamate--cysteine ligase regulatory subunit-like n=1 Tax=Mizuhopecten yessoensis TaxID=6573 RepID=UPI000B457B4D|nr:glutamate--cysteine ligase regulatory subunit-like [Mizuhopecten yessoensis]
MADEIPVVPKVTSLVVHSGNIVNWNRLKRKPNQTPSEELVECVSNSLESYFTGADKNELQYATELDCAHSEFKKTLPINPDERSDLKLTVKIFLCRMMRPEVIKEAVENVLLELNSSNVDVVLLAFPELDEEGITLETIKPYWNVLQDLNVTRVVHFLGISDLDKVVLEELFNWATVKPTINQVNLESCCVMPKDMTDYAKENDIQLLTHNDPRDILTNDKVSQLVSARCTEKDGEGWESDWAIRFSVMVRCRGIIKTKGYIVKASRDTTKKKSQQLLL